MTRKITDNHSWHVTLEFHPRMSDHLFALLSTGLYGNTLSEVAQELVQAEIRRLYESGGAQRLGIKQPW